jgi:hypothetical protein
MEEVQLSKAERLARLLDEALRRRGLHVLICANPECARTILEYQEPIGLVFVKCRRCGLYSELTTTK